MNEEIIKEIFLENNLGPIKFVKKIEIGFTNEVYSINDEFILKICKDDKNENNFGKEVFLYSFFKDKIPVPRVTLYDSSKKIHNKLFMIYPRIDGDNLYSRWHLMSESERKNIIKQLCDILKIINQSSFEEFINRFGTSYPINWKNTVLSKIEKSLQTIEEKKLTSIVFIQKIRDYVETNKNVLNEQKISLVYWDSHFDNILVKNNKIVGILDFERTDLSSIDFVLDILKRMIDHPKKYMSEESEKFAKKEDYIHLLDWFKEFYPELFEFEDLEKRLDLYSIEHDLKDIIGWPNVVELKEQIAKIVGYDSSSL